MRTKEISPEEIRQRRQKFDRGSGPSQEQVEYLQKSLNTLSKKWVFPYEAVRYEMVESGREQEWLYVLTFYFTDLDVYDVRIFVPKERSADAVYGRCWGFAEEVVLKEKERLEKENKCFTGSTRFTVFDGLSVPPLPDINLSKNNWYAMIKFAWKVKRIQEEYSQ